VSSRQEELSVQVLSCDDFPVDDKHDRLAQSYYCRGRLGHHGRPGLM
jgi:hypothetical protein